MLGVHFGENHIQSMRYEPSLCFFKIRGSRHSADTLAQLAFSLSTVPLIKRYRKMLRSTLSAAWSGVQGRGETFLCLRYLRPASTRGGGWQGRGRQRHLHLELQAEFSLPKKHLPTCSFKFALIANLLFSLHHGTEKKPNKNQSVLLPSLLTFQV